MINVFIIYLFGVIIRVEVVNHITTKPRPTHQNQDQNQDQRHKYHQLATALHSTLKMTTSQVVETSVTNNSLSKDYLHPDDHTKQITDTPGFKPFTMFSSLLINVPSLIISFLTAILSLTQKDKVLSSVVLRPVRLVLCCPYPWFTLTNT